MRDSEVQIVVVGLRDMPRAAFAALCARLCGGAMPVVVVCAPEHQEELRVFVPGSDLLVEPAPAGSLARALADAVVARPHARAWVLVPADVEHADLYALRALVTGLTDSPIAHAQIQGRRCYPVAFVADLYGELIRLTSDAGLRRLMARFPSQAVAIAEVQPSGYPLSEYGPL